MATKRLYIGGLSHTISEKDLKDRFGKFGDVQDVELLTRKDEDGVPFKTFGYININISDADYKRCMTVLNKSQWKGGMLQIEVAKESFLHRLAQERDQAAEKTQPPPEDEKEKLVESLKNVGVENFHMKAAVPGTEVPGHKDWVVSKFGRVLPVLNLKCQGKNKIMKYDPSKHSHNIKKLENSADVPSLTPVSQLTWEILEANDEISKKRRGEFPPLKARPTKIKKDSSSKLTANSQSDVSIDGGCEKSNGSFDKGQKYGGENKLIRLKQTLAPKKPQFPDVCVFHGEDDSDEEIRMLVTQRRPLDPAAEDDDDGDNLEVVGDDYMAMKTKSDCHPPVGPSEEDETAYDSADTDEILTSSKTPKGAEQPKPESCRQSSQMPKSNSEKVTTKVKKACKKVTSESKPLLSELVCDDDNDDDDDDDDEEEEEEESGDSDYEAMFTNCRRLEISLADLEHLAKESSSPPEDDGNGSDSQAGPSQVLPQTNVCKSHLPKKGTTPEEILAAILGEDSDDEETGKKKKKKKKKNPSVPLPAFQGTKGLIETLQIAEEHSCLKRQLDEDSKTEVTSKKPKLPTVAELNSSLVANAKAVNSPVLKADSTSGSDSSCSEALGSSEEENDVKEAVVLKDSDGVKKTKQLSKTKKSLPKSDSSSSGSSSTSEEEEDAPPKDSKTVLAKEKTDLPTRPQSVNVPEKQLQDNRRRLAAMEQRQKEAEQQKKLIQGALALDTPTAHKKNHIVFGSDDESDDGEGESAFEVPTPKKSSLLQDGQSSEEDCNDERKPSASRKAPLKVKESEKQDASRLFDSSEDEDEDAEDGDRFQIKPQFEGKSGQKLMQLQSRFGTDERFHMDSRFLDSDDESEVPTNKPAQNEVECELEEEKKKNLDILQNLLNINIQTSDNSKASAKGKTFRDISALQYDPTREEHAAFETKAEEPKKESKAARRKKREEAEKLPEVSKEIYYDVAADLKAVFGTAKETVETVDVEKTIAWDKEEEEKKEVEKEKEKQSQTADAESVLLSPFFPSSVGAEKEEPSGFKFSFFGDNAEAENTSVIDDYQVETLRGSKVPWQADPRFQDSSSEDEEEAEEEAKDQTNAGEATEEPVPTKKVFFFFRQDDERLKEGPKTFYRSAKLEDQREQWEDKRTSLIEEYRKKHKDARKKLKASQKTCST